MYWTFRLAVHLNPDRIPSGAGRRLL